MPDTLTWTSGHAATAPPSAAINALRQMVTGMYPSPCEGCLVKGTIPRREHAVFTFGEGRMPMLPAMSGAAAAHRADLLSNYLSQRFIDPVLPTRPGGLKVIKNVSVNSQRDKLLGIRDGRTLEREFRGLRGCCFKRHFSRLP
jgi:hypothetical protein